MGTVTAVRDDAGMDEHVPDPDGPLGDDDMPDELPPAVADLYRTMGRQCLPSPPVPRPLRDRVEARGDLQWGTEPIDAKAHYMFSGCWQDLVTGDGGHPVFTFGHYGHGINSYFFTLRVRIGPLAAATQCHWSPYPIYADRLHDVSKMARQFMSMRILLDGVENQPGPVRWLLLSSTSRGFNSLVDVEALLAARQDGAHDDVTMAVGTTATSGRSRRLTLPSSEMLSGPLPPVHEDRLFASAAEALGVSFGGDL